MTIRKQFEAMLEDNRRILHTAKELVKKTPALDDGRVEYWQGRVEAMEKVLVILDCEGKRISESILKELTEA